MADVEEGRDPNLCRNCGHRIPTGGWPCLYPDCGCGECEEDYAEDYWYPCPTCNGNGCPRCGGRGELLDEARPASIACSGAVVPDEDE